MAVGVLSVCAPVTTYPPPPTEYGDNPNAPWNKRAAPSISASAKRKAKPKATPEWLLQAAFIAELHALEAAGAPITCAGDMNAGRRSYQETAKCKAMGLTPGETDTRIYLPQGMTLLVEIKQKGKKLSDAQEARHDRLWKLGHNVTTIYLADEREARDMACMLVGVWASPGEGWL
jgi:hypothetical protein